jgi:hypothetical protein
MTWYKKDGKWLKEDGKWAISENCCCGDYFCVRDLHNYHVYSGDFAEDEPFYYSTKPDGGDPQPMLAAQNADDEWVFCAESAEPDDGNGIYIILELPEEGEELEENDIFTVYPLGGSEGYRCLEDCECFHLDEKKCCNECDGQTANMRCIRSWEFDENTMEFIAAHTDEQKCYDNCGKWFCFGDEQCCEDDDDDCDEDTIDYSCRFGASDDGNKLSGPYLEEDKCTENCKEPPECPTCVKEACKYIFDPPPQCEDPETDPPDCEDLPSQGGGWANCCDDLRERWRYETDAWVLLHPCSEDFNAPPGAGTPACKVTTRDFPDNPEDNDIKDFPCEIDWEFEPPDDNEACGETGGCGYSCVELECEEDDEDCDEENLESQCERDPSGNHKTLEDCENKCPPKWQCTAVNECELNSDGEYDTEEDCVERSVQKCGAYGACCFEGECEDGYLEQECIDEGGTYYGTSWCDEDPCGVPKWGTCCSFPYDNSGPQPANTEEEAKNLAAQSAAANSAALPNSTWTIGYFKDGKWFEDEALFDAARNEWTCTGYWTLGNPATCADVDNEDACKGPFKIFSQGDVCLLNDCPDEPPPGPIGCCYTASLDNAGEIIYLQSKATDKECYEFQLLSDPDLEYKWNELEDPNDPCPDEPPLGPGACCYSLQAGWCVNIPFGGAQAGGDYDNLNDAKQECENTSTDECFCGVADETQDGTAAFQVYYICSGINPEGKERDVRPSSEENCTYDDTSNINFIWPEDFAQNITDKMEYTWYPYPNSGCVPIDEGNDCTLEFVNQGSGDAQTTEFFPGITCEDSDCTELDVVGACLTQQEFGYTCEEVTAGECGAEDHYAGLTCEDVGYDAFRFAEPP